MSKIQVINHAFCTEGPIDPEKNYFVPRTDLDDKGICTITDDQLYLRPFGLWSSPSATPQQAWRTLFSISPQRDGEHREIIFFHLSGKTDKGKASRRRLAVYSFPAPPPPEKNKTPCPLCL